MFDEERTERKHGKENRKRSVAKVDTALKHLFMCHALIYGNIDTSFRAIRDIAFVRVFSLVLWTGENTPPHSCNILPYCTETSVIIASPNAKLRSGHSHGRNFDQ